jgi:hypothetical protein
MEGRMFEREPHAVVYELTGERTSACKVDIAIEANALGIGSGTRWDIRVWFCTPCGRSTDKDNFLGRFEHRNYRP